MNDVALITVVMNPDVISDLFSSLEKQTDKRFKLYVIDFSTEDTVFEVTSIPVEIVKFPNRGYAGGINEGVRRAMRQGFTRFCALNDDTFVQKEFIEHMIARFEQSPGTVFGGKIYYASGHEYHKDRYKKADHGSILWYAGGLVDWDHAYTRHRGVDEVDTGIYNSFQQTEFITGCLLCFDKQVINRIGLWDESYFLYFEDADYCERAKRKNVPVYYDPSIIIWHKVSQSTGGSGSPMHVHFQRKNRVKWGLKYAPWRTKIHLLINYIFHRR